MYLEGILLNDEREKENAMLSECPGCDGLGYVEYYYDDFDIDELMCDVCDGTGEIEDEI